MDNDDAIVQVLSDHEHVIDCIVWAPVEACRTIEGANYAAGFGGAEDSKDGNEEVNGDANEEEKKEDASTSSAAGGNADGAEDESRANVATRLTTKERI